MGKKSESAEFLAEQRTTQTKHYEYRDATGNLLARAQVETRVADGIEMLVGCSLTNPKGERLDLLDFLNLDDVLVVFNQGGDGASARVVDNPESNGAKFMIENPPLDHPVRLAIFLHEVRHTKQFTDPAFQAYETEGNSIGNWKPERDYPSDLRQALGRLIRLIDEGIVTDIDRATATALLQESEAFQQHEERRWEASKVSSRLSNEYWDTKDAIRTTTDSDVRNKLLATASELEQQLTLANKAHDSLEETQAELRRLFNERIAPVLSQVLEAERLPTRVLERDANAGALSWMRELRKRGFDFLGALEITEASEKEYESLAEFLRKKGLPESCLERGSAPAFLRAALKTYGADRMKRGKKRPQRKLANK